MRAAQVTELGRPPSVGEAPEPEGDAIDVVAAPLNPIDVAVANGRFYGGHPKLPYVPGCEAVGRERGSGRLVWTFGGGLGLTRNGGMAERTLPGAVVAEVPDGADPALAAALGIAGLAGWMPVAWRAPVRAGETVLVLGASGTVGQVAAQAARLLGAGRVVAAGRDPATLAGAGADATVVLEGEDVGARLRDACGGDGASLIVDPLWGLPLEAALEAAAQGARIVHIGQSAGATATLPSAAVRGKQLDVLGYSNFAVPPDELAEQYTKLVGHAVSGEIALDIERIGLDELGAAWDRRGKIVVLL